LNLFVFLHTLISLSLSLSLFLSLSLSVALLLVLLLYLSALLPRGILLSLESITMTSSSSAYSSFLLSLLLLKSGCENVYNILGVGEKNDKLAGPHR
jgi:hypothetical protein